MPNVIEIAKIAQFVISSNTKYFRLLVLPSFLSFSSKVQLKSPPIRLISSENSCSCCCISLKKESAGLHHLGRKCWQSAGKISNIMYLPFLSKCFFSTLHFILGFIRIIVPFSVEMDTMVFTEYTEK